MPRALLRPLRWRRAVARRSVPAAVGRAPGNFLTSLFGGVGRQRVRMAFGADPDGDPDLWNWIDVSRYLLWENNGVRIKIGYAAGAPELQSALMSGTIRNDQAGGGDFTLGNPYGKFWPHVRENTPVMADLDIGNGPSTRFQGYTTRVKPTRDADGALNLVTFEARGIAWRARKYDAERSPMWRWHMQSTAFPTGTNEGWPSSDQGYHALPTHLWTLEEGSGATRGANEINLTRPLVAGGAPSMPQFGSDTEVPGVKSLTRFGDGAALAVNLGDVRVGGATEASDPSSYSAIRLQLLIRIDQGTQETLRTRLGTLVDTVVARLLTVKVTAPGVDLQQIMVWIDADPTDGLLMYADSFKHNSTSATGAPMGGQVGLPWDRGVYITLDIVNTTPGTAEVRFGWMPLSISPTDAFPDTGIVFSYSSQTLASTTITGINQVALTELGNAAGVSLGMLSVYSCAQGAYPERYPHALLGRSGDSVAERLYRLGVMHNVAIEVVGDCTDIPMGPMGITGFANLLEECRKVDFGLLVDGLGPGYTYIARQQLYSRPADLVVYSDGTGDVLGPDDPEHSDTDRVNSYTASSGAGSSQTFTQTAGDLGTAAIGTQPQSGEHRAAFDTDLYQIAAFKVGVGTVGGLSWPQLRLQLAKPATSVKLQRWIEMLPGRRITIVDAQPDLPEPDRDAVLLGWQESFNSLTYDATANTGPYDPYAVTTLAADTGDTGEFLGWLDTEDGCVLGAALPAGYADGSGFEASSEGWTPTGATAAVITSASHSGTSSYSGTVTGAPAQATLRSPSLPVVAGQLYGASMWLQTPGGGGYASTQAAIDWYDAASGYLSTTSGSVVALPSATWTQYAVSGTAPAGAAFAQYGPTLSGSPPNGTIFRVDDGVFGPASTVITATGPVCTNPAVSTYADDLMGLVVKIDGLLVPVLDIAGSTSPQTFIFDLTAITRALPAGASVVAADPVVLGL